MRTLKRARVTIDKPVVGEVIAVMDEGMKEPWLLAVSTQELTGSEAKRHHASRFTCEESFRDIKDLRYGPGCAGPRSPSPSDATA